MCSCSTVAPRRGQAGSLSAAGTAGLKPVRVELVGDSTVASYEPTSTKMGWGQVLGERLSPQVEVVNLAKGGRSSKSFIAEGLWEQAKAERADFVLIQFGHNDCPGKGDRSTDPQTTYTQNLTTYVQESRAAGAMPILVTPVGRRKFDRDGNVRNDLTAYAEAMRQVASELKVPLVDLNAASVALYQQLGDEGSAYLSCDADDRTHFSPAGARVLAGLVADGLRSSCPCLADYVLAEPGR